VAYYHNNMVECLEVYKKDSCLTNWLPFISVSAASDSSVTWPALAG
jgi:hypothetical protein